VTFKVIHLLYHCLSKCDFLYGCAAVEKISTDIVCHVIAEFYCMTYSLHHISSAYLCDCVYNALAGLLKWLPIMCECLNELCKQSLPGAIGKLM